MLHRHGHLFGEEWNDATLDNFEPGVHVTPPPHGWTITGWEYYAHKDALGIVTIHLSPPPATLELRNQAADIGRDLLPWIDTLDEWRASLTADIDNPLPARWYLTDLRHLHNLGSAQWQGFLPRGEPETPNERTNAILNLEISVQDWLEDHFVSEDEETE